VTDAAVVVVGGTLSALVTADALAREGRPVLLLLPARGVGGGFMPVEREGRRLERGMRVLELHYEGLGEPPPIEDYRPGDHGHRPWTRLVRDWVGELVGEDALVEIDPPAMAVNGRVGPEVLLRTDLEPIRELLDAGELDAIAAEAAEAVARLGPAGILDGAHDAELWSTTFEDASLTHHGRTLHERLIAPFCAKVRPEGATDVPVALRRRLWVPLFWPRTVHEVASGAQPAFRPQRPLHTIEPGGTGEIVHRLLARLREHPSVRIWDYERIESLAPAPGGVRLRLAGRGEIVAPRPVLAAAPAELFAAAGIAHEPRRVHSSLAWAEVAEDDLLSLPGFVHVVEPSLDAFRITPGERRDGSRILCVELRHDLPENHVPGAVRRSLEGVGIVREGAAIEPIGAFAGPTFTAPTAESVRLFEAARARFAELGLDAVVIGGANVFGADTLNEHVVQGLATARALA
jgi:hypothetical protein